MFVFNKASEDILYKLRARWFAAATLIGVSETLSPLSIVEAIHSYVKREKKLPGEIEDSVLLNIGAFLGEQYVRKFGWYWGMVHTTETPELQVICVIKKDNSLMIEPAQWVEDIFCSDRPVNFLLNFNVVMERCPIASPNEGLLLH